MTDAYSAPPATVPGYGAPAVARPCYSCGRDWGGGIACQFCRQVGGLPSGIHITSAGKRFGGYLLEGVLVVFTAFIGWLIWALIVFKNGQTPAKQILGMRVVSTRTNRSASWGTMALREIIAKPLVGLLAAFTLYIVYFWLLWDANTRELWDKMVGTIVVNDPQGALRPDAVPPQQQQLAPAPTPPAPAIAAPEPAPAPAAEQPAKKAAAKRATATPAKRTGTTKSSTTTKSTTPAKSTTVRNTSKRVTGSKTATPPTKAAPAKKTATKRAAPAKKTR